MAYWQKMSRTAFPPKSLDSKNVGCSIASLLLGAASLLPHSPLKKVKVRSAAVGSKREAVAEWAFIFYSRSEKYGHMVDGSKTTTYSQGA